MSYYVELRQIPSSEEEAESGAPDAEQGEEQEERSQRKKRARDPLRCPTGEWRVSRGRVVLLCALCGYMRA